MGRPGGRAATGNEGDRQPMPATAFTPAALRRESVLPVPGSARSVVFRIIVAGRSIRNSHPG